MPPYVTYPQSSELCKMQSKKSEPTNYDSFKCYVSCDMLAHVQAIGIQLVVLTAGGDR